MPSTQHIGPGRQAVRDHLARAQAERARTGPPAAPSRPVELSESHRPIEPQEGSR